MTKLASALALGAFIVGFSTSAFPAAITSLTLEMVSDTGEWTNAPGGIWSTNAADSFTQLGIRQNGSFLNLPGSGFSLGEIAVELAPGLNTFELFGSSFAGGAGHYGLAFFFDSNATPPDIVVFNADASSDPFSITPAGTTVAGSANGGIVPDIAPGKSTFLATDGSRVELIEFSALYDLTNDDLVSFQDVGPDGNVDTYATFTLKSTPAPEPATIALLAPSLFGFFAVRSRKRRVK
jgi:hypothetical protein